MEKGKIIVIEGTDCSGKATQAELLVKYLKEKGEKVVEFSYPRYDTPTGKIIGGPYLGKSYISSGWFAEGADKVNPKVASLYYAADRLYNNHEVEEKLNEGYIVLLDRYVYSNMGHQAGKFTDPEKRHEMYKFIEKLEFELLGLPKPDVVIFLYMPPDKAKALRVEREEKLDEHEANDDHLLRAEASYLDMAQRYDFKIVNCLKDDKVRTIEDIHEEIVNIYNSLT